MGQNILFDLIGLPTAAFGQHFIQDPVKLFLVELFQIGRQGRYAHFSAHPWAIFVKVLGWLAE